MSSMGFPTENLTDGLVYEKWQYNATTGQWEIIPVQVSPAPPVWTELSNDDIKRNSKVGIGKTPNASLDVQTESNSVGMRLGLDVAPDRDLIVSSYAVETTNAAGWDFNASDASHGTISFSTLGNKRLTIDHTGLATFSGKVDANLFETNSNNFGNISFFGDTVNQQGVYVGLNGGGDLDINNRDGGGFRYLQNDVEKFTIDATGDATFSGTVDANGTKIGGSIGRCIYADTAGGNSGLHFGGNVILPCQGGNIPASSVIDIGGSASEGYKFKNAYFSGTVDAASVVTTGATNLKWGTASKLRVNSDGLHFDDWIRSSTNGKGWYHTTGGGGWFMNDTTWIRAYGSKAVYVANQIAATGDVTAFYSDERLKEKVGTIDNALEAVQSIETFLYKHNDIAREHGYDDDKVHAGVSAQSVERVLPEIVDLAPFDYETLEDGTVISKSGEDYKTVKYEKLTVLLIEAIKEQQTQINELKERLEK